MGRTLLFLISLAVWFWACPSWGDEAGVNSDWQQRARAAAGRAPTPADVAYRALQGAVGDGAYQMAVDLHDAAERGAYEANESVREGGIGPGALIQGERTAIGAAREITRIIQRIACQGAECGRQNVVSALGGVVARPVPGAVKPGTLVSTVAVASRCQTCGRGAVGMAQTWGGKVVYEMGAVSPRSGGEQYLTHGHPAHEGDVREAISDTQRALLEALARRKSGGGN